MWTSPVRQPITGSPVGIRERPEMIDPFAEVVALLQPSLPFSKQASGAGSWRVDISVTGDPMFCVILEGAVRLTLGRQPEIELGESDFILLPAACDFTMTSLDG